MRAEPIDELRAPVRWLKAVGAEILVQTNAAGSLRPEVGPGSLMAITDHINLTGTNVLIGPNDDSIGPRFPPMGNAYDADLLVELRAAAAEQGLPLAEGVYTGWSARPSRPPRRSARCASSVASRRHVDRPRDDRRPSLWSAGRCDLAITNWPRG